MLIDEVTITVRSGHGGSGKKAFNKNAKSLGPTGGSGGNGGNVYAEGVSDLGALSQFRYKKDLAAEDGKNGKDQFHDGTAGQDLILKIPVGTIIINDGKNTRFEILKIGERIELAKGGRGGKGNFLFRSSRNTTPLQFQEGLPGESFVLKLELKLIADIGLIGLPNVGKSSLLNALTRAESKVGNYAFTTLEPNLGVYYELIVADIPGLIEGAAGGKGLGIKFLRHVERTHTLFHLISTESENPQEDYKTIRHELGAYNPALLEKKEYVFLTKCDTTSEKDVQKKLLDLKKLNPHTLPLSLYEDTHMKQLKKILEELTIQKRNILYTRSL